MNDLLQRPFFAPAPPGRHQRGLSLVELMVAIVIALFIALGLSLLYVNMKSTFNAQDQLAQLQDSQRLAATMLTTTVESTAYYPGPSPSNTPSAALPASTTNNPDGSSFVAGQGIVEKAGASGASDTLNIRYQTSGSDTVTNCLGATATTQTTWVNTYFIDANNNLSCAVSSTVGATTTTKAAVPLVANVSKMTVLYGVDINSDGSTDTYLPANLMTAALWPTVRSVRITLSFLLPAVIPGGAATTQNWTQTIRLMNNP